MYEERVVESRHVELDLAAAFSCNTIGECVDKLVDACETDQEAVIVEEDTCREVLKVVKDGLVHVDKSNYLGEALQMMPRELLEPDLDESKMRRGLVEKRGEDRDYCRHRDLRSEWATNKQGL